MNPGAKLVLQSQVALRGPALLVFREMAKSRNKQFIYNTVIEWQRELKGLLSSSGKPNIEIATPPEFRGHPEIWSPEDLFVASVNSCIMTTFLYYAQRNNLNLSDYKSEAPGILEMQEGRFTFAEIKVKPEITVGTQQDYDLAREFINKAEKACPISNSIKSKVSIESQIIIKKIGK